MDPTGGAADWSLLYGRDPRPAAELMLRAESLLARDAQSAEGWTLLARASELRGKTRFARQAMEQAFELGAANPDLRAWLARICCDLGNPAGAATWLRGAGDGPGVAFAAAIAALARRDSDAAVAAFTAAAARDGPYRKAARWSAAWLAAALARSPGSAPDAPVLAVLDYKSPDLGQCGANLGDHIQTAAVLRQAARLAGARLSASDPATLRILATLAPRVAAGERIASSGALRIEVLDRDMPWPAAERLGGRSRWMLAYGWWFHRPFSALDPLPAPDGVEALAVSFHLAAPKLLRPDVIAWLRRCAPVGCRDWTTVGWLLNQGIDAFFSGCVTTTLSAGDRTPPRRGGVVAVDAPTGDIPGRALRLSHHDERLRTATLEQAIALGLERLDLYARARRVVTSRLHCYLPCRALGTPVEMRGAPAADIRFDGLVGVSEAAFAAMAADLDGWIGGALGRIAAGQSAEAVKSWWREATAEAVAEARARLDIAAVPARRNAGAPARSRTAPSGPLHVIMPVGGRRMRQSRVALGSLFVNASRPLHFWPQAEGAGRAAALEACQGDRALYLAGPLVALADVAALADQTLGACGLAARPDPGLASLGEAVERHAASLDAGRARRFRAATAARVDLTAPAFDADICVAAPATLRRLEAARACAAWMDEFGVDDALALNLFAGGAFAELPARWNHHPYAGLVDDPALIHWREPPYPWQAARQVLLAHHWREYETSDGPASAIDDLAIGLEPPFTPRGGFAWTAPLPEPFDRDLDWTLREDGRIPGPARADIEDIRALGRGRHIIGLKAVWLSASDNGDPNASGRRYRLTAWSASEGLVGGQGGVSGRPGAG